jgi:thiamine biosynthesis lipoprotein
MQTVTLARNAMATRFELVLHGEDARRLQGAGEEALSEIERIEAQLSIYRPSSELSRVNSLAAKEPVRVTPSVFKLLELAHQLHHESGGAFDIAIAPLVRCWGFMGGTGAWPDPTELAQAREQAGMRHVILNAAHQTVRFDREGVMLDLGAIGKGYAVDQAAAVLRDAGVNSALIHGGTSTVYGVGAPPGGDAWKIAIESPPGSKTWVATVPLRDEALSVSAVWGKSFQHDGKTLGHVLDPRTGQPANNTVLAAVALPSATETDALSTALLVRGTEGHEAICRLRSDMRTLVVVPSATDFETKTHGIVIEAREKIEKRVGNW